MTITKYGHCCLLIEVKGVRILTDPGSYSTLPAKVSDVDAVFITHEHADHIHIETLKSVLKANPNARVITNASVGKLLDRAKISYDVIREEVGIEGVRIEARHGKHALIHKEWPMFENTGLIVDETLFYPGDALSDPKCKVQVLALPVAGPWLTLANAIDYARAIKPKQCFPVHDGNLKELGATHSIPEQILAKHKIQFTPMLVGDMLTVDA